MECIVLIGMPASGKSSVGRRLAARLLCPFIDGDDLIRARTGMPLDEIIAREGADGFLQIEQDVLLSLAPEGRAVIAPGGSAVYSAAAMAHLRSLGKVVYLSLAEEEIARRIPDFTARGVVMRGATLKELYEERVPLYERYADLTIAADGKTADELAKELSLL